MRVRQGVSDRDRVGAEGAVFRAVGLPIARIRELRYHRKSPHVRASAREKHFFFSQGGVRRISLRPESGDRRWARACAMESQLKQIFEGDGMPEIEASGLPRASKDL